MKHFRASIYIFLTFLMTMASIPSCLQEQHEDVHSREQDGRKLTKIRLTAGGMTLSTKSVLTSSDIENMVSGVTLAAYNSSGDLEATGYFEDRNNIYLSLNTNVGHTLYALVNMGDLSASVPVEENSMERYSYRLSTYAQIDEKGIPMAGKILIPVGETSVEIEVRRLMAKVCVVIDHSGISGQTKVMSRIIQNVSLYVKQCNSVLTPFRETGSRASSASDLLSGNTEYEDSLFTIEYEGCQEVSSPIILYVPENLQGSLLSGNTDQWLKTPEGLSAAGCSARSGLCTYMEFNANKIGEGDGVSGKLVYRFFIGNDTSSNFDVRGNTIYNIHLHLTSDGMYTSGNWKVTASDWSDRRKLYFSLYNARVKDEDYFLVPGQSVNVYVYFQRTWYWERDGLNKTTYPLGWMIYFNDMKVETADSGTVSGFGLSWVYSNTAANHDMFTFTASDDESFVGKSCQIRILTTDGAIADTAYIHIMPPQM